MTLDNLEAQYFRDISFYKPTSSETDSNGNDFLLGVSYSDSNDQMTEKTLLQRISIDPASDWGVNEGFKWELSVNVEVSTNNVQPKPKTLECEYSEQTCYIIFSLTSGPNPQGIYLFKFRLFE